MYRTNNKLLLATLLLLCAPACFAERADRDKPMHLDADQVIMDDAQKISTFTGNVRLSQGTLLIRGDKICLLYTSPRRRGGADDGAIQHQPDAGGG